LRGRKGGGQKRKGEIRVEKRRMAQKSVDTSINQPPLSPPPPEAPPPLFEEIVNVHAPKIISNVTRGKAQRIVN